MTISHFNPGKDLAELSPGDSILVPAESADRSDARKALEAEGLEKTTFKSEDGK